MNLTLADAQKLAIQNHPRIAAARYVAAAAAQVPKEYHSAYEPSVIANLTGVGADNGSRLAAGGLNNPVVYNRFGSGMTVSQLVTDFGRTGNLVQSARLRAQAQDQAAETARANVLLEVSRAYFGVLRAQAILRVAGQTVAARQLVANQVSALAASKLKSTLDVSFANVNLFEARLLQSQAESNVKAAEAQLATAMGLPDQSGFQLADEAMPAPLPDVVDPLIREAISNRPELKDLRLQESAQLRYAKAEHALNYPSLGVVGTAGFAPLAYASVPGKYGAIGVNVSIPIFNGGLYRARQTEAELRAKAVAQNASEIEQRIARDVRVAYLNATNAYDRLALTRQLLANAQSAADLAQTRYDMGLGSIVEVSQAQLNLTSAEIAGTTAQYDYQTQRILVDYETGNLR